MFPNTLARNAEFLLYNQEAIYKTSSYLANCTVSLPDSVFLLLLNKHTLLKLVFCHYVAPWPNMAKVTKQRWVFDRFHPLHVKGILWKGEKREHQTQTPSSEGLVCPAYTQFLSYREKMNEKKGNWPASKD